MNNWKKIAIIVAVVIVVGLVVSYLTGDGWKSVVNAILKWVQAQVGVPAGTEFQLP